MKILRTTKNVTKGMPIGLEDDWKEYLFRIVDQVDQFQIVTKGAKSGEPVTFISEVFWVTEDDVRSSALITVSYSTHEDAENGHANLVFIASLAETSAEFPALFEMVRHHFVQA